jgi:hypothetical protein
MVSTGVAKEILGDSARQCDYCKLVRTTSRTGHNGGLEYNFYKDGGIIRSVGHLQDTPPCVESKLRIGKRKVQP